MNIEQTISAYLDTWNQTDPTRRREAIEALFTEDCRYTDPMADVSGRAALDALIAGIQAQFAGLELTLAGRVDAHHSQARFTWHAAAKQATEPVVIGFDVVLLSGERIKSVYGFLDKVPG